jgi:hypothetical protein
MQPSALAIPSRIDCARHKGREGSPSMDLRTAASTDQASPDPDAVAFIRFCYERRRVGWPELYDEMCAVASRGLFRGYGPEDLAERGIRFGLFEMPGLAAASRKVIAEEHARRRPVTVVLVDTDQEPAEPARLSALAVPATA